MSSKNNICSIMGSVALRLQQKSLSAREHHCPLLPITHFIFPSSRAPFQLKIVQKWRFEFGLVSIV
jgi:hypothetical protein